MSDDLVQTGEATGADSAPLSGDAEVTSIIETAAADLTAKEPVAAATGASGPPDKVTDAPLETAPPPAPGAAKAKSPSKAETAAEEAELAALEQELGAKDPRLKRDVISAGRHQAVLTKTRRQHEAQLAQAAQRIESLKQFESREFQERLAAFQIAERDPDRFLQVLQAIPDYRDRLMAMVEAAAEARARQYAPVQEEQAEEEEPQPDTLLESGGMGYSTERANQLWAYRLRQAQAEYEQKLAAIEEHIAPIQEERRVTEHIKAAYQRQGGILADARQNWPLFSQYEPKIRAELAKPGNERMQLDQAYRVVVVNAERAQRAQIEQDARTRIQNGSAAAPRSLRPGLPPVGGGKDEGGGGDEIESIIRNASRALEGR